MFMVMDSHLKEIKQIKLKKHQKAMTDFMCNTHLEPPCTALGCRERNTPTWTYNLDNHFIYKPYSSVQVLQIMCLTRVFKNLWVLISVKPVEKKTSPTTKSCNGSALFPLKIITNITLSITDLNKWTFEHLQLQSNTGPLIWIQSQTKGMIR